MNTFGIVECYELPPEERLVNNPNAYSDLGLVLPTSSRWTVSASGWVEDTVGNMPYLFCVPENMQPIRPWLVKGTGNRLAIGAQKLIILDLSAFV